jgi:acetyltransferase-like isoleucine patch superfamily enzyme
MGLRRPRTRRYAALPPFAAVGAGTTLGTPHVVDHPERIRLGAGVHLGDRVWLALVVDRRVQVTQGDAVVHQRFDPRLTIGDRTRFGRDLTVACCGEVAIGADVVGGDRILLADTYHDYRDPLTPVSAQAMAEPRPLRIEDGAWLGTAVIVNRGLTIGAGAVVQHGSVVTRDVAPRTVVAGNPAVPVGAWP